jgi:hypothetical protein
MTAGRKRAIARAVAIAWAGFWTYFVVGTVLSEHSGNPWTRLAVCSAGILLFPGSAFMLWRFEAVGRLMTCFEGLLLTVLNFTFFHNRPAGTLLLLLTLCLPPLLAGALLLTISDRPDGAPTPKST